MEMNIEDPRFCDILRHALVTRAVPEIKECRSQSWSSVTGFERPLLSVLFAMLRSGKPYDPSLRQHGVCLIEDPVT